MDGSRRILLQSLVRPDLGITVLRLEPDGQHLVGGDESWHPGAPPLISAQLRVTSPRAADMLPPGSPVSAYPSKPAAGPTGVRRPPSRSRHARVTTPRGTESV